MAGGAIIESILWQWIFWVNVPFGLVLLPLARWPGREPRSRGPARPPGRRARHHRPAGRRLRDRARQRARVGQRDGDRLLRRRRGLPGPVRPLAAPCPGADAPAAVLPLARLRRHLRRLARDVVRHLRLDLPVRPVLPDRQGLRAARGRAADAALDRHADARGPDRRRDVRPHRLAPADGGRARSCRPLAIVWLAAITSPDVPYSHARPRLRARRDRHGPRLLARRERDPRRRASRTRPARPPGRTTRSASSAASSASPSSPRCSAARAATSPARRSSRACGRRCGSARPCWPPAPLRPCWCRGGLVAFRVAAPAAVRSRPENCALRVNTGVAGCRHFLRAPPHGVEGGGRVFRLPSGEFCRSPRPPLDSHSTSTLPQCAVAVPRLTAPAGSGTRRFSTRGGNRTGGRPADARRRPSRGGTACSRPAAPPPRARRTAGPRGPARGAPRR